MKLQICTSSIWASSFMKMTCFIEFRRSEAKTNMMNETEVIFMWFFIQIRRLQLSWFTPFSGAHSLSITYRRQLCPSNVYHMNLSNTRGLHDLNVVNRVACVNVSMNVCVWFFGRSCFLTVFFLDQDKSFARYLTFIQWRINFDGTSWRCIENDATLISCHVPFELESLSTTIFR